MFEPRQLLRGLLDEVLDDVLIPEEVGALDRVVAVHLEGIVFSFDGGGPALGGDRVAPHGVNLGDQRDGNVGIRFDGGDRGAQAGRSSPHDDDVVAEHLGHEPSIGLGAAGCCGASICNESERDEKVGGPGDAR